MYSGYEDHISGNGESLRMNSVQWDAAVSRF